MSGSVGLWQRWSFPIRSDERVGHEGRDYGYQADNKCKHHAIEPMGDRFKAVINRVESVYQPNLEGVEVCLGGEVGAVL
jgi:hypothetical protein